MSIENSSIPVGATITPTGGTATDLLMLTNEGSAKVYLDDGTEFIARTELEFKTSTARAKESAPNGYTQPRSDVIIKEPLALDNGNRTVNTIRVEQSTDVETTDAERLALRMKACLVILGADFLAFWDDQARA